MHAMTDIHPKTRTAGGTRAAVAATAVKADCDKTAAAAESERSVRASGARSLPEKGSARGAWERGGEIATEITGVGTTGARARGIGLGQV